MNGSKIASRSERLIEQLAAELVPVRPIPPLRRPAAALIACWLAFAAALSVWPGAHAVGNPGFFPTFVTIGLVAVGAAWAALALCAPGRDAAVRVGLTLCGVGLAGICVLTIHEGFPPATLAYLSDSLWHDWICVGIATGFALPLWAIILAFGRRAWISRRAAVATTAGIGSVAAGAMLVHVLCAEGCARHALGSHALAPLWGTGALLLPALFVLRDRDREDRGLRSRS